MQDARLRFAHCLAIVFCIWTTVSILLADPGFSKLRKREIELQVRKPAAVRLSNTTIAFRASATNPEYAPPLKSLEATLETELVGNEKTLVKKAESEAEWILGLQVTGFSIPQPQRTKDE